MINAHDPTATPVATDLDPATIFETDWQIYRTLVDNNLLFHQEVSEILVQEMTTRFSGGFRFLDLACGDADVMSRALRKTTVDHYLGVDLSPQALAIAAKNMEDAPFDARMEQMDILTTLSENPGTYDVIWCGLCLHHFQSIEEKTQVFSAIHSALSSNGVFFSFEPVLPEGISLEIFDRRNRQQFRKDWSPPLTEEQFERLMTHIETCDFPETAHGWLTAGRAAGFSSAEELFAIPDGGYCRLFRFEQ
ncbi:class I SAM-dependent methyltransferase [Labrenzia sp. R4_1]|uniref:class I SAM-dependent methyltransferase n=1 Tax=Labrenzia sp. R4_1 TaxID=2821106 RepID=UPI001ADCDC47|nr:class I SAM-dependent methyltransferase [Labrenzia sp. R4_1]MBO9423274.1 class I SAM-dependent methyltransferase [Labrenzia sp. R4_1]